MYSSSLVLCLVLKKGDKTMDSYIENKSRNRLKNDIDKRMRNLFSKCLNDKNTARATIHTRVLV